MRVSYKWLSEYIDLTVGAEELAGRLTMAGLEVDEIEYLGTDISGVVTAKVLTKEPVAGSDHLSFCTVDSGQGIFNVVCGASNVAAGQTVPFAMLGACLPGGKTIGEATLAGVTSQGMICSQAELGITHGAAEGIWVLPDTLTLGQDIVEAVELKDEVLILELTPNRADCLGLVNVAHEAAALGCGTFKPVTISYEEKGENIGKLMSIEVIDKKLCPRYLGRLVQEVKIGPSPLWLQRYLWAAGIRSINNVVDISNFVLMETGQPLHIFDYQELSGQKIIVRQAKSGEQMTTLDGKERVFTGKEILICDDEKPVCLAGVMGGLESEVTAKTTDILIESAVFDPAAIRRTARRLGIPSEASLRFEKGVDIANCDRVSQRAVQLLLQICGGRAAQGMIDVHAEIPEPKDIILRTSRVNNILGTEYTQSEIKATMDALAFPVIKLDEYDIAVQVPTYRRDITLEVDLIEEVARLRGYNNIPAVLPGDTAFGGRTTAQNLLKKTKEICIAQGLSETINYSFIGTKDIDKLNLPADHAWRQMLDISNPLSEDQSLMRTTLLPGLLNNAAYNHSRRNTNIALFEYGNIFIPAAADPYKNQPQEIATLGFVLSGAQEGGWQQAAAEYDYFYLKGIIETIFNALKVIGLTFDPCSDYNFLHPGRSAIISLAGENLGYIGELHPQIAEKFGLEKRIIVCEIMVSPLIEAADKTIVCADIPKYPASSRDIALIGDKTIAAADIKETIFTLGGEYLHQVELFDTYEGAQIAEGCRSLAYSLTFQALERTLTDKEVDETFAAICKGLDQKWGLRLR